MNGFFQCCAKRRDQGMRQIANETDRIGNNGVLVSAKKNLARGGVECREKLIRDIGIAAHDAVKQRRFTGIGIANDRDIEHAVTFSRIAL